MKKTTIPLLILLMVTLFGGLVLVKQNQDTRKGASFANTALKLIPNTTIERRVGEVVPVKVYYYTESGAKVDGVQTDVCWGSHLSLDESGVVVNTANGFNSSPIVVIKDNCATLVATSQQAASNLKTTGEVFALNFKALREGQGPITIKKESSMVTGDNPASATDKEIAVTTVENTTYKIIGSTQTCETDADCPPGYECYQPPMPSCAPGENCLQVMPPKYCRPMLEKNCDRCSIYFDHMRLAWQAQQNEDCSKDPLIDFSEKFLSSSADTKVTIIYDAKCMPPPETRKPNQCSRCSKVNDQQYTWWLRGADETCDDDPSSAQTIYRAYKEDCHLSSGQWPVLNYKVQYAFVKSDYSQCFVPEDWPLQVIVLSGGVTKAYNNVVPSKVDKSGDFVTVQGSLILEGFDRTNNVAVFMKGPKHLQMKYAVDKQANRYGKAGGELTLTKSIETSPVYDFTAYPILSGDVIGKNSDSPDGVVDGYDWAEVKRMAKVLETVEDGGYIESDLDGSCQVNSNDLYQLRKTLEEKQGELY
ncbi:MAG TPA: hypothetical protein PK045_02625 [Candidatus Woesebacteria bacterium]|nr:hypothetical protein [Candidatus Shapirobacteria bacterium]HOY61376.1 hypothetical protein [Candidatus Woesebacteria bacterium]